MNCHFSSTIFFFLQYQEIKCLFREKQMHIVEVIAKNIFEFIASSLKGGGFSDSEGLAVEIVRVLHRVGLDVSLLASLLVGQGYDGASAMSGEFNGVQKKVRDMCESPAVYVQCVSHVLNLTRTCVQSSSHTDHVEYNRKSGRLFQQ